MKQPDVYHSREHLDFGKGLYLTSLFDQAHKYVMRFLLRKQKAYINGYMLEDELSDFKSLFKFSSKSFFFSFF
ncbi:MAG: DUF3990 domain-containing protein [Bacteroides sp.]|nr:DUF3990 domain-containing protein [Bacteroides sp.]